ncbi:MAG: hypothetical protein M3040_13140 [Bacteroidota bacterium]|nr:hypothetical protein [Bacteroidota bacterium]
MKTSLILILLGAIAFAGCSSSAYPGSSNYPSSGSNQYPYPNQYPPGGTSQYPYPTYPSNQRRNDQVVVTRDGRVIDKYGRVVGTTQQLPPSQPRAVYGSRPDRSYDHDERRNDERYERNRRHDDDRYEKRGEYERHAENEKHRDNEQYDGKGNWKNTQSDRSNRQ